MIKKLLTLNSSLSSVHAAAFLIGSAGFISRLLGMLRNRLLAAHFGAGRELDIYFAAFQIPDFVSTVFLLGAGSAAILPVFQEYMHQDKRRLIILFLVSIPVFLLSLVYVRQLFFFSLYLFYFVLLFQDFLVLREILLLCLRALCSFLLFFWDFQVLLRQ